MVELVILGVAFASFVVLTFISARQSADAEAGA